jgi:hypothetical protein
LFCFVLFYYRMSFVCVAYVEADRKTISTVPSNWIKNGVLHWPRRISKQKFHYNKRSDPSDDWQIIDEIDILKEGIF